MLILNRCVLVTYFDLKSCIQAYFILYLQEWVGCLDLYSLTPVFIFYRLFNVLFNLVELTLVYGADRFAWFGEVYHRFFRCSIGYFTDGLCVLRNAGRQNVVVQQEVNKTTLTGAGLTCQLELKYLSVVLITN